jgi:hypothetical protein
MAKQKSKAVKGDEPRLRGEAGPPGATKNEKGEGRARKAADDERAIPKVSKHDANRRDSWGGGLH